MIYHPRVTPLYPLTYILLTTLYLHSILTRRGSILRRLLMNWRVMARARVPLLLFLVVSNALGAFALSGCDPGGPSNATPAPASNALEIKFAYSSEKKPWIEPLAAQ